MYQIKENYKTEIANIIYEVIEKQIMFDRYKLYKSNNRSNMQQLTSWLFYSVDRYKYQNFSYNNYLKKLNGILPGKLLGKYLMYVIVNLIIIGGVLW